MKKQFNKLLMVFSSCFILTGTAFAQEVPKKPTPVPDTTKIPDTTKVPDTTQIPDTSTLPETSAHFISSQLQAAYNSSARMHEAFTINHLSLLSAIKEDLNEPAEVVSETTS